MIKQIEFEKEVFNIWGRDISRDKNPEQNNPICSQPDQSMFIVAGPGSGKTTVLVLKVLKLIFVDDIEPSSILITTYTRKAAFELRSRILGWGDRLRQALVAKEVYSEIRTDLEGLDFNGIRTGTLDSILEEALGDNRDPGTPPPTVIEDFVAKALMLNPGLFNQGRHNNKDLHNYLLYLRENDKFGYGLQKKCNLLKNLNDRFYHDQVNLKRFRQEHPQEGARIACDAIIDYNRELENRLLFDFCKLENEFLTQLRADKMEGFLSGIKFILVDEYQDTNLLQEQIYFKLGRFAVENGGSITVVGDDDQSLYRFRGATVDLFRDFPQRILTQMGINVQINYLIRNYRSTTNIVDFCNQFLLIDRSFQDARVSGKPAICPNRLGTFINYPILGIFRDNIEILARDLANFIHQIVHGNGYHLNNHKWGQSIIKVNKSTGSAADIAVLCSSPQELGYKDKKRLPLLLRNNLEELNPPISVFNPRGQILARIHEVMVLCGFILECIDPNAIVQNSTDNLPPNAAATFQVWRSEAQDYISSLSPSDSANLIQFISAWQKRKPLRRSNWDKREITLIDLIYKLVTWIPNLQDDIEGLVYLEAITRTITQAALFCDFRASIVCDRYNQDLEQASIREAIRKIFAPIALGAIEINEDLLETLPRDRINIMSIHQAKGLEFPLVVVDVGSEFRTDHRTQRFKRFPENGGETCTIEDDLRRYSPLDLPARSARDRAFDDLIRQYFVAFSRAQDILVLAGLNSAISGSIPNVAIGWDRNKIWQWSRLGNIMRI